MRGCPKRRHQNGLKVALVGSGPASLIAAFDLVRRGYRVTVFEALHKLGGVLVYGIPKFRLPREIIDAEIDRLRALGVEFRTNFIVGKTTGVEELLEQGYAAVFLATGAGLPRLDRNPRREFGRRVYGKRVPDADQPDAGV